MKSINFQRKDSVLRVLEEDKRKKRSINWDRIVYFIILGVIAFFIFRYAFVKLVYIEGSGQVLFEKRSNTRARRYYHPRFLCIRR